MIDMSQERALAELLCEITRNIHAAAALAGMLAAGRGEGDSVADRAFKQADSMMRHSRLPNIIDAINEHQTKHNE